MEDKLKSFFLENNFDFEEPNVEHIQRFENKLNSKNKNHKISYKWLTAAASIILIFGFWLGTNHQKKQFNLADVSPKMEEVQTYFVNTINLELKNIEQNRNLDTETIIEEALDHLEELEEEYNVFLTEINTNGKQTKVISAMIKNYQKRLEVLENVLEQIEQIKNPKIINNEIYI